MDFDVYNKSFEEIVETFDEEADNRLRSMRQRCVREFIGRLNKRQQEWDTTFRDLLKKSQELDGSTPQPNETQTPPAISSFLKPTSLFSNFNLGANFQETVQATPAVVDLTKENEEPKNKPVEVCPVTQEARLPLIQPKQPQPSPQVKPEPSKADEQSTDPHFSNLFAIKEFIRIQELLDQSRKSFDDLNINTALKSYRNQLNLFIRTQINSISNSDSQHLDTKIKLLTSLFCGQRVSFQDRLIDATQHPQGQLFSMDLAAQTFVTVGTRLVNSVPAIAKSMATVVNGIVNNNLPIFKDLLIGHLQERCPYLIPMHPKLEDFSDKKDKDVNYMIACGYSYDTKSQTLESEDKYLSRMRSMVLIYACILIQGHINQAWTWLASFLSLKPQPVISATILQAFLQESSKKLSSTYGRQYNKILAYIRNHYVKMLDEVTPKTSDRQSFIKLKNLLSDDSNLIAAPSLGSIFGTIRY